MTLPYREGTWFAVPLRGRGHAIGVVARASQGGGILLGYFFGPRRENIPSHREVSTLVPDDAVLVAMFGDMGLIDGTWPILGSERAWQRSDWPVPDFVRSDPDSGRWWRVRYSDHDPNEVIEEIPLSGPDQNLPRDRLCGAGSIEVQLGQLLP